MIKVVLFDFNGVIVDDEEVHYQLFNEIFTPMEITLSHDDYFTQYVGLDDREMFKQILAKHGRAPDDIFLDALILKKNSMYFSICRKFAKMFDGVEEFLKKLPVKHKGIVSGALKNEIMYWLRELHLMKMFEVVVSADDIHSSKPLPDGYLKALSQFQKKVHDLTPADCLVVEDTVDGVRAAKEAGMKVVGVTNTVAKEKLSQADLVVEKLEEVDVNTF
ncbi:HAD family hydrolase [Candidatus Margulisiibacteriota bacterium]